jgi:hypothetical protein
MKKLKWIRFFFWAIVTAVVAWFCATFDEEE